MSRERNRNPHLFRIRREPPRPPVIEDFHAMVGLLRGLNENGISDQQRDQKEGEIDSFARDILVYTYRDGIDNREQRGEVMRAFDQLVVRERPTALAAYRRFLQTDVLDRQSLRSHLGLPLGPIRNR